MLYLNNYKVKAVITYAKNERQQKQSQNQYHQRLWFSVIRENYCLERKDWKLDLRVNEHTELEIFAVFNTVGSGTIKF